MKIKGVKYVGPILDGSGYAQANRGNILALYKAGVPLTLKPISFEQARPDLGEDGKIINSLIGKNIDYDVVIVHTTPEFWENHIELGKINIGYTIWETDKLHPDWPKYINNSVDKVLVGCEWNKEVFEDSGVTIPIGVVPHVVNTDVFKDIEPYTIAGVDENAYTFYSIFQWCYDEKTRVLTKKGFKYFKDLTYDDYIATFNNSTEILEYQKPEKIVRFRRKDKMISLQGHFFDMCVTPDHKMLVRNKKESEWYLKPLNELFSKGGGGKYYIKDGYYAKIGVMSEELDIEDVKRFETVVFNPDIEEIDFDGYVYCATVPNHIMLVERNGKVIFSGNTERKHPVSLIKSYWYAFQNKENVALILKSYRSDYSEKEKEAIRVSIKRLKSMTPMDNYPPIYLISHMLSNDEVVGLHKKGDCYFSTDRGEGFGLCVAKDTKITVPDGVRSAEKIIVGDEVMSSDGLFHKVIDVSSKYISNALKFSVKLHEDIIISENHPFLVCNTLTKHKRYNHNPSMLEENLCWLESKDIKTGDYLAIPKPKLNESLSNFIDISNFIECTNLVVEVDNMYLKNGFSPKNNKLSYKNLVKDYGYTKKIFEGAVKHIKRSTLPNKNTKTSEAYGILNSLDYKCKSQNKINRFIDLNDSVLSLFGWYIAEGSTNNNNFLEIDLHKDEYDVAVFLSNVFKEKFNVSDDSIFLQRYENKSRLVVSNKIIATLFSNLFGSGAYNKHIPGWLFRSGIFLKPLIKSLFAGDGYDSLSTLALTTISPSLAYQTKLILNSLGYCPRINKKKKGELGNYPIYLVSIANNDYRDFLNTDYINRESKYFIETDNYFLVRVYSIERVLYDDFMYDFSVENSKNFLGNGILLHNSPFMSGSCGKPIIVTGFGGSTEYAKPDNSYLIDYQLTPCSGMPWCMSLKSLVKTTNGYIWAKDLEEGDVVENKNLTNKYINKVVFRKLLDSEEMYSLKHFSVPTSTELTSTHKLYVLDDNNIPVKRKVSEINVGDYLYVPKPNRHDELILDEEPHVDNITLDKQEDLFYLFGLYLAEGYIDKIKKYIGFSFNINEKHTLAFKCKECMYNLFPSEINSFYERDLLDRNGYEMIFYCNVSLLDLFEEKLGCGSHFKFITNEIKYSRYNHFLLKGYWDGDGHIRKEGYKSKKTGARRISPECVAETASFDLSMDIRDVLLSLGIVPSLYSSNRKDGRVSYIISVSDEGFDKLFDIQADRIKSRFKKKIDSGFGVLITKKELIEDYDDLICSISVDIDFDEALEDGGSYILNGIASSNSPWYRGNQLWAEPDVKHAAELLRHVYNNQEEAKETGKKLEKYIWDNFTYEVIGQKLIKEIENL